MKQLQVFFFTFFRIALFQNGLFCILFILLSVNLIGQINSSEPSNEYIITKRLLSIENGLVSRQVYCGLIDDEGFMWLGTDYGLTRFDGKKFELFTTNEGLKHNKIISIVNDNKSHLLITYGKTQNFITENVDVFDLKTQKLFSVNQLFNKMPFEQKDIVGIYNDQTSDIYFMVQKPLKVWKYNEKDGFTLRCLLKKWWNYEMKIDTNVFARKRGELYSFYNGYISLTYNQNFPAYFFTPKKEYVFDSSYFLLNINKKGVLFYFHRNTNPTYYGEMTMEGVNSKYKSINYLQNEDISVTKGCSNYFSSNKTGNSYYFSPFSYTYYFNDGNSNKVLIDSVSWINYGNPSIYSQFEDNAGNFWICTSIGLIKVNIKKNRFSHYCTDKKLKNNEINSVRGIYADKEGNVFSNISNSFYKNDIKLADTKKIERKNELLYGIEPFDDVNFLISVRKGLLLYNTQKQSDFKFFNNTIDIAGEEIWCLKNIEKDKWLCGSNEHLYYFETISKKFKYVKYASPFIPEVQFVYRIIKTRNGELWTVAESGMYKLNNKGDSVLVYFGKLQTGINQSKYTQNINISNLRDFYEDNKGVFWIATNGDGLYSWNRKSKIIKQFTIKDGLSSNALCRIEADNFGKLWISSDYGLNCFDYKSFLTKTYTTKDGVSTNEFNRISSFKAANGKLYFGGLNGINSINPKDFLLDSNKFNAPVSIIAFNQYIGKENKLVDLTIQLKQQKRIVLEPNDKFFTLAFKLLNFEEEEQRYAYKIEGELDNDWNYISENSIRISGLPYGKFILLIKGQNIEGNWSNVSLKIPIEVLKPFYLEYWFIVSMIIVIIIIFYGFIYIRTKSLNNENIKLEKVVKVRTSDLELALVQKDELLKEVHHRVKNNLQLMISMLRMQLRTVSDKTVIDALINSQSRLQSIALVHEKLYKSSNINEVLLKEYVQELIVLLAQQYEKTGTNFKFQYIDKSRIVSSLDIAIPIGLIINELVTNSFKYAFVETENALITITMNKLSNGHLQLIYKDNGIGLPINLQISETKTLGFKLIQLFTEQLNGKLNYKNEKGVIFEFEFNS